MFQRRILQAVLTICAVVALTQHSARAQQSYEVSTQNGVAMRTRDGVTLNADIYHPKADGKFPVILMRTPYDKSVGWAASPAYQIATHGYVVIVQDVRGSNYHENWTYQGGALEQWFDQNWATQLATNTLWRLIEKDTNALVGAPTLPLTQYPAFNYAALPAGAAATAQIAPYYLDWLAHPSYDAYWKQWSIEEHFSEIQVPALHIGGWYDIFLGGTLRNYMGIKAHGGTDAARNGQRLLIQIGGHAGFGKRIGDVEFGDHALEFPPTKVVIDWYDYLFKGVQNEFATEGSAAAGKPVHITSDQFTYDPANPVRTIGGSLCCDAQHYEPGPRDQRAAENRNDVLVYSTKPLANDMEVTGPVTLELWAKSSAVDTDFTAKLVDVSPDGFATNLTDGILRMRYRDSQEKPALMNPNQVYKISVDLWATSNVFKKGHIMRLEVSSSNFPRFDRNLNTGADQATSREFVSAVNTILHDDEHPSALIIPVMPSAGAPQ